jgi:hypothetical protein
MQTLADEADVAYGSVKRIESGLLTSKRTREVVRDTINRELQRRREALKEITNGY